MIPTTFQALVVLLLAIVPGFVAIGAWARTKTWKGRGNDLSTVLQSLAVSLIIQVVAAPFSIPFLFPLRSHLVDHPGRLAVWLGVVAFALPLIGGFAVARVEDTIFDPRRSRSRGRLLGALDAGHPRVVREPAAPVTKERG